MNTSKRIGIIGGGYGGLTAAYELQKQGYHVTVLERDDHWGGQAATIPMLDTYIEHFYHHLFGSDTHIINLMEEMGLADRLEWIASKVGFYHEGQILDFITPMDLLRFAPLSLWNRIKLGLMYLYMQRVNDWRPYERITAKEWLLKYMGQEIYDKVWGALLRGKFGNLADEVAMVWLWGKIKVRASSRRGAQQQEKLAYPRGSFQVITDALLERLRAGGADLRTGQPVDHVVTDAEEPSRVTGLVAGEGPFDGAHGRQEMAFDAVICTAPGYELLRIAPQITGPYADNLRAARYQAALVLLLVSKHSLSHIYWMNIPDRSFPFVAVVEHTNYMPPENYQGRHIIYVSNYLSPDDPRFHMEGEELLRLYTPHLQRINPEFDEDWVEQMVVLRDSSGQPVITRNYSQRLPDHRTPLQGLYLANALQIYPEDRGTNYAVMIGQRIARIVHEDLVEG